MAAATTDITPYLAELSDQAFEAFCDDIAGMFDVDMRCERRQAAFGKIPSLRERFKKLAAVHFLRAEGSLSGTFHLIFDQAGLFVLGGVIVMLPEPRILESIKRGSLQDAESLQDAAREAGNLLVGAWDRIFRQECEGHKHFLKTSTFIGKPWEDPSQTELQTEEEALIIQYEMTIEAYPSFTCAAVFPKTVLAGLGDMEAPPAPDPKPTTSAGASVEAPVSKASPDVPPPSPIPQNAPTAVPDAASGRVEPAGVHPDAGKPPAPESQPGRASAAHQPTIPPTGGVDPQPPCVAVENPARCTPHQVSEVDSVGPAPESDLMFLDPAYVLSQPRQGSPKRDLRVLGAQSDPGLAELLRVPAADIMEKDVVWADPEDTVQDVIAKMQQHNVGYVLVGRNGVLEGLVSSSNILGAVSLYLRPMFAKWRRPEDDATLGVKVKWIMSRPVRTVRTDATLAAMIESMRRCGGRCLPVVDARGTVQGLVNVFDILLRVLAADKNFSWQGRPPQAPALLI